MRQLEKWQSVTLAIGALFMVLGAGGVVFGSAIGASSLVVVKVASIVFALGAVAFAAMQMAQTYEGNNFVIRRLRRIMVIGDVCFIIAALLMIESNFRILFPYMATTIEGYTSWVKYVYNNWVVALLIAAIIEMYTTHRIAHELNKEERE